MSLTTDPVDPDDPDPDVDPGSRDGAASASDGDDTQLDFGSLRVPAVDGMQLRVEMDDNEKPVAVAVMLDDTVLQLQAFAAPKSESLWDEVRQEIAEGIRGARARHARQTDRSVASCKPRWSRPTIKARQRARTCGSSGSMGRAGSCAVSSPVPGSPSRRRPAPSKRSFVRSRSSGAASRPPRHPLPLTMPDNPRWSPRRH